MNTIIEHQTFGQERALYGQKDLTLRHCAFEGAEDGESALKECRCIAVYDTLCRLRYPFWHDQGLRLERVTMTDTCRAALWYDEGVRISDCRLHGTKALRECSDVVLEGCDIVSEEFGWNTRDVTLRRCCAQGAYFLMRGENLTMDEVTFHGKYSFQYVKNAVIENCVLDTKDAFWHAENVTLRNCELKGEYLAWYAVNLRLEHCRITGTQPFCYCRGLVLEDCEMHEADLAFERSEVQASITTPVISIKNPLSGTISVPAVQQLIFDLAEAKGQVLTEGGRFCGDR